MGSLLLQRMGTMLMLLTAYSLCATASTCLVANYGGAEIYSLSLEVIADHEVIIMATPKSVIRIGDTDVGHKTGNRGETVVLRFAQLSNQGDRTSLVHKVLLNVINAENGKQNKFQLTSSDGPAVLYGQTFASMVKVSGYENSAGESCVQGVLNTTRATLGADDITITTNTNATDACVSRVNAECTHMSCCNALECVADPTAAESEAQADVVVKRICRVKEIQDNPNLENATVTLQLTSQSKDSPGNGAALVGGVIFAVCGGIGLIVVVTKARGRMRSGSGDMEIEFGKFNERKSEDNETMETRSQSQSIRSFTGYEPRDTNYLRNKVRSSQMSEGDIEALIAGTRKYMSKYEKHHSLGSLDSGTTALSRGSRLSSNSQSDSVSGSQPASHMRLHVSDQSSGRRNTSA